MNLKCITASNQLNPAWIGLNRASKRDFFGIRAHHFGAKHMIEPHLINSLATSIIVVDSFLGMRFVNSAAEELLNVSNTRAAGKSLDQFIRLETSLVETCGRVLSTDSIVRLHRESIVWPVSLNGQLANIAVSPVQYRGDNLVLLEIGLLSPQGQDWVEPVSPAIQRGSQIIKGLAHEIRNPLGGIRGAAQLLADEAKELESDSYRAFSEYTNIIIRETDRLTGLVSRMQTSAQFDFDDEVNVHSVLEQVRKLLVAEHGTAVAFKQDYDPSLPFIRGNEDMLVQAVLNITQNAVEANSVPNVITFVTRVDRQLMPGSTGSSTVLRVDICDRGQGIPEDLIDRVFEPMMTTKSNGSGLGLSITAEIIEKHDGMLRVQSRPGKTCFSIYLKFCEK